MPYPFHSTYLHSPHSPDNPTPDRVSEMDLRLLDLIELERKAYALNDHITLGVMDKVLGRDRDWSLLPYGDEDSRYDELQDAHAKQVGQLQEWLEAVRTENRELTRYIYQLREQVTDQARELAALKQVAFPSSSFPSPSSSPSP